GVARSSVSLWVRDVPYVPRRPRARRDTGPNRLARAKADEIQAMRAWGAEAIDTLSERDLLIAGTALYAGEGDNRDGCVGFANTNAAMVALFLSWLRTFFDVDESRLRCKLYLHEGLDLEAATAHWSVATGIPTNQFTRPYRATPDPSIRHAKHAAGCAKVLYA